jgi:hypothetical protein
MNATLSNVLYSSRCMAKAKTAAKATRREAEIPDLAKKATRAAFNRAVKKNGDVLVYEGGALRKVGSTGKFRVVKKMAARTKVAKGTKFVLKAPPKAKA